MALPYATSAQVEKIIKEEISKIPTPSDDGPQRYEVEDVTAIPEDICNKLKQGDIVVNGNGTIYVVSYVGDGNIDLCSLFELNVFGSQTINIIEYSFDEEEWYINDEYALTFATQEQVPDKATTPKIWQLDDFLVGGIDPTEYDIAGMKFGDIIIDVVNECTGIVNHITFNQEHELTAIKIIGVSFDAICTWELNDKTGMITKTMQQVGTKLYKHLIAIDAEYFNAISNKSSSFSSVTDVASWLNSGGFVTICSKMGSESQLIICESGWYGINANNETIVNVLVGLDVTDFADTVTPL